MDYLHVSIFLLYLRWQNCDNNNFKLYFINITNAPEKLVLETGLRL